MAAFTAKLKELVSQSVDDQCNFFTQRFVFSLGDAFSDVLDLAKDFKSACEVDEGGQQLSAAGAADFLQKHGKTRTALQRSAEIKDIDVNNDRKIGFIEYLLLHYKVMILEEHFRRQEFAEPPLDLSGDGVGLTGVGEMLVEELFQPPLGLDPELERMMTEFSIEHNKREERIAKLQTAVDGGGVKGMAAKNELEQLKQVDDTEIHAVEAKIAAAVKKANFASKKELQMKSDAKAEVEAQKLADGRSKMADRMAMFNK